MRVARFGRGKAATLCQVWRAGRVHGGGDSACDTCVGGFEGCVILEDRSPLPSRKGRANRWRQVL